MVRLLLNANALAQLLRAPVLGCLPDRYEHRPHLVLDRPSTAAAFMPLGLAKSLPALFLSRLLDGILLAQACVVDVTDEKSRAKGLGLIGASFGLGLLLVPDLVRPAAEE